MPTKEELLERIRVNSGCVVKDLGDTRHDTLRVSLSAANEVVLIPELMFYFSRIDNGWKLGSISHPTHAMINFLISPIGE